jgi:hypothetical protein
MGSLPGAFTGDILSHGFRANAAVYLNRPFFTPSFGTRGFLASPILSGLPGSRRKMGKARIPAKGI